jgi:hypothetical protein
VGRYLLRFDSGYYPDIASTGCAYNGDPLQMQNIVFFPGSPMLFGAAARILPITLPFSSGFVSNLCAAAAMLLLSH